MANVIGFSFMALFVVVFFVLVLKKKKKVAAKVIPVVPVDTTTPVDPTPG
jgi:hypothetical protein